MEEKLKFIVLISFVGIFFGICRLKIFENFKLLFILVGFGRFMLKKNRF